MAIKRKHLLRLEAMEPASKNRHKPGTEGKKEKKKKKEASVESQIATFAACLLAIAFLMLLKNWIVNEQLQLAEREQREDSQERISAAEFEATQFFITQNDPQQQRQQLVLQPIPAVNLFRADNGINRRVLDGDEQGDTADVEMEVEDYDGGDGGG